MLAGQTWSGLQDESVAPCAPEVGPQPELLARRESRTQETVTLQVQWEILEGTEREMYGHGEGADRSQWGKLGARPGGGPPSQVLVEPPSSPKLPDSGPPGPSEPSFTENASGMLRVGQLWEH